MKNKQKPRGMKHKIREEKKREQRIGLAVTVAILIAIISVSGFFIHLIYYPLEAGDYTIQNIIGNIISNSTQVKTRDILKRMRTLFSFF